MSEDGRYEAVRGRDARFDGEFFFAVATTGIYCRPSCPATTPRRKNVRFFPTAAAAQGEGFRACRRCRPDAVPGSAAWNTRADVVGRAMRMIGDGVVDREGVAGLARRLGYSPRQVQRQLNAELGAGPIALARAQRAHTARILLQTTGMQATEIAFAAGFSSVRQFNDTLREIYAATPSELRAARPRTERTARSARAGRDGVRPGVALRLAHRGPYAATEVFDYLARRALTGVEEVIGAPGARTYRRTLRLPHGHGIAEVDERHGDGGWLECRLRLTELRDLTTAIQRVRRLFDLDADPYAVAERLGTDPALAPLVAARPGLRSPGAVAPEELAVRAVLGQQVSVAAGRGLGNALVAAYGEPLAEAGGALTRLFPRAEDLADAPFTEIGMPGSRRATLRTLATALVDGSVRLDAGADRERSERELLALRGIGPWTAGYIRMRALGDPDVLLAGDVAVRAGARRAGVRLEDAASWRPWRSYAMHHCWNAPSDAPIDAPSGVAVSTPATRR
ncbi:DNA-3-methyladenine glycosylase 2 family protein [Streptomyces sp. NA02950]|uniref:AlkA N-terminal domain-containing protein n=1 Tax=Streptomyces sp. NA02950 TaxID=2742137 RepID=UPI0015911449|nr:AlkA N-terminal domain-containing protein [Streptomyces sp. NA02950]QKV98069.1 DNA-3-methyladenine glycosylase 2 family protein [Streptomyces sp. NA02950]